jgi:predicted enzyme related to lactoylglutathione lyase
MGDAVLEHVNITVTDVQGVAELLCRVFDWKIRWHGDAIHGGKSCHVGGQNSYVAIYSACGTLERGDTYQTPGSMNHIGVVVDDPDAVEGRVVAEGFTPRLHSDYEPGKRFYFYGPDRIGSKWFHTDRPCSSRHTGGMMPGRAGLSQVLNRKCMTSPSFTS